MVLLRDLPHQVTHSAFRQIDSSVIVFRMLLVPGESDIKTSNYKGLLEYVKKFDNFSYVTYLASAVALQEDDRWGRYPRPR